MALKLVKTPSLTNSFSSDDVITKCPVNSYHCDGMMRTDGNHGATLAYEPNSFGEWKETPSQMQPPLPLYGDAYTYNEREYDNDYYTQPGKLWLLMSDDDKKTTCDNTAAQIENVPLFIKQRHVRACHNADPEYGRMLADSLGISLEEALVAPDPARPSWDNRPSASS